MSFFFPFWCFVFLVGSEYLWLRHRSDLDGNNFLFQSQIHQISSSSEFSIAHRFANLSYSFLSLSPRNHTPSPNLIVSVSGKKGLSIRTPSQADALRLPALFSLLNIFRLKLINFALLLQVENGDAARCRSAEPVAVGREDEGMDLISGLKRVEVFRFIEIPEHSGAILPTGGAEGSVGGDGDSVDVAGVTDVVGLDPARGEFPDLHEFIPASTDDNWILGVRAEPNARHPFRVSLVCDGKFAVP